jgi:hypothetical protein
MKMEDIELDSYQPNYTSRCENCEQSPTVTGVKAGKTVYESGMCGPCTFGTAAALDPAWWNSDGD